ncbi:MAG: shikimate kinase [Thermoplasmata archaeon]|nr:MAG: shikimate kinase [Thermoplasmata archaeon]
MEGSAYCYGAATIINGIAAGLGAAYGIGLITKAKVILTDEAGVFDVKIEGDEGENPKLAEYCVLGVLKKFNMAEQYGAKITTSSDIPISKGLKSSSAAANAIILSTFKALDKKFFDMEIINLGIDASFQAKVTITGAFDDSCATYFGNVAVTDNLNRKILAQYPIEDDFDVIIHVPPKKIRKTDIDPEKLKGIKDTLKEAHTKALNKDYKTAIRINGSTFGKAMGLDTEIASKAIEAGAVTAGISGTGPSTVILAEPEKKDNILAAIGSKDGIICTKLNRKKAGFL